MILADKIIRLRKKNGWSQEELADKMNVSRQAVSKWESSQTIPDLDKILQLSTLFGVTTDYLLKDEIEDEELTNDTKTWLYTIGRNVAIDYLRHNAKQSDTAFDDLENYIRDEYDLEKLYIIEERKITVHRALRKLNTEYRQVLWLLYFDGLSNVEAAIVMKKSSRQMKNLVYRAKSALKSELDKEGFVYEEL